MPRRRPAPRRVVVGGIPSLVSERVEDKSDGSWHVRLVTGSASAKTYRCPGCSQLIARATPHAVTWPVEKSLLSDAAIDERRHWHTACWKRKH